MDIQFEIKKLYECRLLRNESECEMFDRVLENLAECTDEKMITELCMILDDETEEEEIMFGLIHLIESFQMEIYLTGMSKALPKMMENAQEWAMILNKRILNNDMYRSEYANILVRMNKEVKSTVIHLLNEIKADNPRRFGDTANEVIDKLKES
ncbi:Imm30 family immunity protein [Bacillus sp. DX4.1]|uniref:Imm30 family immunity protein n=1 Tax=Bacillus sp. DX4.1 TaxID=3055867 RepID=UPI0025A0F9BD|nr:Imm30 family immunity protein [Bacillus sp. DX4.1]MDM5186417.1 Imm30 family immunity protein [Bacillus sp. DX4.1]